MGDEFVARVSHDSGISGENEFFFHQFITFYWQKKCISLPLHAVLELCK